MAVFAAGLGLSALALYLLATSVDLAATSAVLGRARFERLVPILGVLAVQFSIRAWRWSRIVDSLRPAEPIPVRRFLAPLAIGYLGNAVLPARLGEPLRAAALGRAERLPVASVLGTVLVERVVDTLTLAALAGVVAAAIAPEWIARLAAVAAAVGVVGLVVLVVGAQWVAGRLRAAERGPLHALATVAGGAALNVAAAVAGVPQATVATTVVLSLAAWVCDGLIFWLAAVALGIDLSPAGAFIVGAVTVLGTAIPSSPGFVGTFEAAAVAAGVALGVPAPDALALGVLAHLCSTIPVASVGALAVVRQGLHGSDLREPVPSGSAQQGATPVVR